MPSAEISFCQTLRTPSASPRSTAVSAASAGASQASSPSAGLAAVHDGADQPHGIGRFDAGGDDLLQQHLLDAAAALEFHQGLLRAARRRNAVAGHGAQQVEKLRAVFRRLLEPRGQHRLAVFGGHVAAKGRHGRQLPELCQRGEERQPPNDPLGLADQLEVGRLTAGVAALAFEHLAFDVVFGAAAKGHAFVGRAVDVVVLVVVAAASGRSRHRPIRNAALPKAPRRWLPGNRGTSRQRPALLRQCACKSRSSAGMSGRRSAGDPVPRPRSSSPSCHRSCIQSSARS